MSLCRLVGIKEKFKKGDQVRILSLHDEKQSIQPGDIGIIVESVTLYNGTHLKIRLSNGVVVPCELSKDKIEKVDAHNKISAA